LVFYAKCAVMSDHREDEESRLGSAYWKNQLLLLQESAVKPTMVTCEKPVKERPAFFGAEFHGLIGRDESDRLLASAGEGSYLVRQSRRAEYSYTLCIRFDGQTKNYKLFYDGQHFVGEKRFDSVEQLVADGLISMHIEKHAADYVRRMAEQTIYEHSPYSQFQRMRQRLKEHHIAGVCALSPSCRCRSSPVGVVVVEDVFDVEQHQRPVKSHTFKVQTFLTPHWCDYCGNYIWGLVGQGLKCEECGFGAHRRCAEKAPQDCRPDLKYVKRTFGVDLTTFSMAHRMPVPHVVECCVDEIERRGLDTEGLYRVSGSHEQIEKLRLQFDADPCSARLCPAEVDDVHALTGLLKLYFRLLPIPLVTYAARRELVRTVGGRLDADPDKLKLVGRVLRETLPAAHQAVLALFARHLHRVAELSHKNRMTDDNLARILVLTLMTSSGTVEQQRIDPAPPLVPQFELCALQFLIKHAPKLFIEPTRTLLNKQEMGLSDDDVKKQLRQMIAFIEQEANEKAEEIDAKAEEEFNIEKGRLVQQHRSKIMDYYERKEKQVELQRKIQNSAMFNQARLRILKAQEDHISNVLNETRSRLLQISNDPTAYPPILKNLIIQALLQLLEPEVTLRCRQKDLALLTQLIPSCVDEARKASSIDCRVSIDRENFLADDSAGGVEVYTLGGKIRVASTLESRLEIISDQLIPDIRVTVFGRNPNRKFLD
ncbi:N-chimaerin, partial [Trichinella zimbabwensis]